MPLSHLGIDMSIIWVPGRDNSSAQPLLGKKYPAVKLRKLDFGEIVEYQGLKTRNGGTKLRGCRAFFGYYPRDSGLKV